jgi:hypothetical protein
MTGKMLLRVGAEFGHKLVSNGGTRRHCRYCGHGLWPHFQTWPADEGPEHYPQPDWLTRPCAGPRPQEAL